MREKVCYEIVFVSLYKVSIKISQFWV